MQECHRAFRGSGFKIFANMIENDPKVEVWAIPAPKGGGNRAFCDRMNSWAQGEGQPGLGYIFWREGEEGGAGRSPRTSAGAHQADRRPARPRRRRCGFFVAGKPKEFVKFAGPRAPRSARSLGLIDKDRFEFCWIVDFPMYEWNEEEKKIDFSHNPFSMPNMAVDEFLALDPRTTRSCSASRRSSTTSSATASSCRPARSATIAPT
jgi:aspartyl-tRNA synthetase